MRGRLARSVLCLALVTLAGSPAEAHLTTDFAGVLEGTLSPASPTLQFKGTFDGAGRYNGQQAAGGYDCTASGPNAGVTPFGGPFSGTFSCAPHLLYGSAPSTASGAFQGWTNLATIAMKGDFNGHTFNCEGTLTPKPAPGPNPGVLFGVALGCVIQ